AAILLLAGLVAGLVRDLGTDRQHARRAWAVDELERLVGLLRRLVELATLHQYPREADARLVVRGEILRRLLEGGNEIERAGEVGVDLGAVRVVRRRSLRVRSLRRGVVEQLALLLGQRLGVGGLAESLERLACRRHRVAAIVDRQRRLVVGE